jgi:hypothetical protein
MIATVISKSVETDHVIAYVTNLEQYGLVCTRCGPDPGLYKGLDAPKKKIKTFFAAEARVTMG